jgi:hypothetical protein
VVRHGRAPHLLKEFAENIADLSGSEPGCISPLTPKAEHQVSAAKGGLQEGRHEKADMKSAWSVKH